MQSLREVVIGSAMVVLLLIAAGVSWSTSRVSASVTTASATPSAEPVRSGPGFTVCTADASWRRPSADEQRAHLTGAVVADRDVPVLTGVTFGNYI